MSSPRLLRPAAKCPSCSAYPPVRITSAERERHVDDPPDDLVGTVQCGRCKTLYDLHARAYQLAG